MEIKERNIIFIIICVSSISSLDGFNTTAMIHLHESLFEQYNQQVPPFTGNNPISVYVDFSILDVYGLDMRMQYFSTSVALKFSWYDSFLKWNKNVYGNLTEITTSFQNIWQPDIIIMNSMDPDKEIFRISDDRNVIIKNDGLVNVQLFLNLRTRCLVNTTYYPFDSQICDVIFSNIYMTNQYQILKGNFSSVEDIVPNGEWEVLKLNSKETAKRLNGKTHHNLIFMTKMKRLRTFYTWNFIVPVASLALANLFTFFIPAKSSEKMGVSLFVFLSLGVLTRLFNESIPSTSKDISLFGRLLWINLLISGCIIGVNTILTALYHCKSPKTISDCCHGLTEWLKCKNRICTCCKKYCNKSREPPDSSIGLERTLPNNESREDHTVITHKDIAINIKDGLEQTVINHRGMQINMGELKNLPSNEVGWSDVSRNLDLILGVVFFLFYIGVYLDMIVDMIDQPF